MTLLRTERSLVHLLLAAGLGLGLACSATEDPTFDSTPDPEAEVEESEHDDLFAEQMLSREDIEASFALEDGWWVGPLLEAPELASRVGMMIEANEPDARFQFEAAGLTAEGEWTEWIPLTETWSEEYMTVAIAELGTIAEGARIRLPAEDLPALEVVTWSALIPDDEGDAEAARREAQDDELMSTRQALIGTLADAGVNDRSAWRARTTRCTSTDRAKYRMAIHHTVTPTSLSNVESRLRGIQAYHMDSRGWCDVGYHFLISADGRMWEGRPLHLRGAHVGSNNTGNAGISYIGCFNSSGCGSMMSRPTPEMLDAGGTLVAALSEEFGISIDSTRVKGHRDHAGASTSCPGDYLWGELEQIRETARNPEVELDDVVISITSTTSGQGYWMVDTTGSVSPFGDATDRGNADTVDLDDPVVDSDSYGNSGYWLVTEEGQVLSYGNASHLGDIRSYPGEQHIKGIEALIDGSGYWLVGQDGRVYAFGNAGHHGSPAGEDMPAPIVGMAAVDANGYWLLDADGRVYAYGDATHYGEATGREDVSFVDIAPTPWGRGYWLAAANGEIYAFGDARFMGSPSALVQASGWLVVDITPTSTGRGYWLATLDGALYAYGDARYFGSLQVDPGCQPVFQDVPPTHPFFDAIQGGYEDGLWNGCESQGEGRFCPDYSINRAQGAIFVAHALDLPLRPWSGTFADVYSGQLGDRQIQALADAGITMGCSYEGDRFCPESQMSRSQMAVWLARGMNLPLQNYQGLFSDVPEGHFAARHIEALFRARITVGCSSSNFCPGDLLTRGQAAELVARAFEVPLPNGCQ